MAKTKASFTYEEEVVYQENLRILRTIRQSEVYRDIKKLRSFTERRANGVCYHKLWCCPISMKRKISGLKKLFEFIKIKTSPTSPFYPNKIDIYLYIN